MVIIRCALVLFFPLAFLTEFFIGALKYGFHPLNLMGRVAVYFEKLFYFISDGIVSGIFFNIFTVLAITTVFAAISSAAIHISPAVFYALFVYILSSFLSAGGLRHESIKIYRLLKTGDIESARKNLSSLAGRDSVELGPSEISRAVIESVAENTGDGIGSVFFYSALGLIIGFFAGFLNKPHQMQSAVIFCCAFAVIYKTVNLLDSLVGYRNVKYEKFGKFSARIDDALNYIPFRITACFMFLSVFILDLTENSGGDINHNYYHAGGAFKSWCKFRKNHPSPNGGQLESIMAGALNIKLGGINYYAGVKSERPVIGFQDYGRANEENIINAVRIMELASALICIFCALIFAALVFF